MEQEVICKVLLTWANDGACGLGTQVFPLEVTGLVSGTVTPVHDVADGISRQGFPRYREPILCALNSSFFNNFCTNRAIFQI